MNSVLARMASGAAWTLGMRVVDRLLGLVSTLVLARLLIPADFGLVAMGTSLLAILNAATEFGFTQALLQRPADDHQAYDTAWSLSILTGASVAILLLAFTPAAVGFYGDDRVGVVLATLALISLVAGLRNTWVIAFERELSFRPLFTINVAKKVCMVVVTIACAVWLSDYRALLIGMVTGASIDVLLSFTLRRERPRWRLAGASRLFDYSKWWLLHQSTQTVGRRGQDVVIGRRLGAEDLGTYSVAHELASLPTSELSGPIMRAVFPGYMQLRSQPEQLSAGFLRVWAAVAAVSIPAAAGIFYLSDAIIFVVLGSKWAAAAPLLGVLSIVGGIAGLTNCYWPLLLACRGPKTLFQVTAAHYLIEFPLFAVLLWGWGLQTAIWGLLAASLLFAAWCGVLVVRRLAGVSGVGALRALMRPALATAVMCGTLALLDDGWWLQGSSAANAVRLLLTCGAGALVYGASLMALWYAAGRPSGLEGDLLRYVRRKFGID